jgi:hypothetical protein
MTGTHLCFRTCRAVAAFIKLNWGIPAGFVLGWFFIFLAK